jgi:hypothetical protein
MAAARVGHHSNSPFAPHSVSRKSTHPVGGSNRHPPEAVSYTTTEHFGQATGAISECYHSGAYIQTEALPRILVVLGWNRPFRHSTFGRFGQRHAKRLLLPRRGRRARRLCKNCTLDRNRDTRWETKSNTGCTRRVPRRRVVILLPALKSPIDAQPIRPAVPN